MNRALILGFLGALLGGGLGVLIATASEVEGEVFIAGDQPISEVQVREKMRSEGWLNVQVIERGRYFEISGAKDGRQRKIMVDALTGRLIDDDDYD